MCQPQEKLGFFFPTNKPIFHNSTDPKFHFPLAIFDAITPNNYLTLTLNQEGTDSNLLAHMEVSLLRPSTDQSEDHTNARYPLGFFKKPPLTTWLIPLMGAFVTHTICDCSCKIRLSQANISETVIIQTYIALYIPNLFKLPTLFRKQHFVSALSQYPHMQNISNLSHHRIFPGLSSQPAVIGGGLLLSLFTLNKSGHDASIYCLRFIEFQTFCLGLLPLPQLCLTLYCHCLRIRAKIKFSFNSYRLTTLSRRILS